MQRLAFVRPCAPTLSTRMPVGPRWIHEPKLDGWRLQIIKDVAGVRLLTRGGADYTARLPCVVAAVERLRAPSVILDAELCVLHTDGVPDFHGD